mgnify:CR=1 FL=1
MTPEQIRIEAEQIYHALRQRQTLTPVTSRNPDITLQDAYSISKQLLTMRLADGERVIGKKIGLTSKVVQDMLGVHQPDFGFLTDAMMYESGAEIPLNDTLVQAKSEGEIAFILKQDLIGPNVSPEDVLAATESVAACFEIVDSRIENWQIKIQDTVADNASCGVFVMGDRVSPEAVDFENCKMIIKNRGEVVAEGQGSAALGSPLNCVAWLANALCEYGVELKAGDIILSGSLAAMIPSVVGDDMTMEIEGIGHASYRMV